MEPVVAELLAFVIGVGFLPGWKGWLGNGLVIAGTFAVVYRPHGSDKTTSH
jgi:drug/metabolite transporter (DMT)-like permease